MARTLGSNTDPIRDDVSGDSVLPSGLGQLPVAPLESTLTAFVSSPIAATPATVTELLRRNGLRNVSTAGSLTTPPGGAGAAIGVAGKIAGAATWAIIIDLVFPQAVADGTVSSHQLQRLQMTVEQRGRSNDARLKELLGKIQASYPKQTFGVVTYQNAKGENILALQRGSTIIPLLEGLNVYSKVAPFSLSHELGHSSLRRDEASRQTVSGTSAGEAQPSARNTKLKTTSAHEDGRSLLKEAHRERKAHQSIINKAWTSSSVMQLRASYRSFEGNFARVTHPGVPILGSEGNPKVPSPSDVVAVAYRQAASWARAQNREKGEKAAVVFMHEVPGAGVSIPTVYSGPVRDIARLHRDSVVSSRDLRNAGIEGRVKDVVKQSPVTRPPAQPVVGPSQSKTTPSLMPLENLASYKTGGGVSLSVSDSVQDSLTKQLEDSKRRTVRFSEKDVDEPSPVTQLHPGFEDKRTSKRQFIPPALPQVSPPQPERKGVNSGLQMSAVHSKSDRPEQDGGGKQKSPEGEQNSRSSFGGRPSEGSVEDIFKRLQTVRASPPFKRYLELLREGKQKGFFRGDGPGTRWLVKGGQGTAVQKARGPGDEPAIMVPPDVYDAVAFGDRVEEINKIHSSSNSTPNAMKTHYPVDAQAPVTGVAGRASIAPAQQHGPVSSVPQGILTAVNSIRARPNEDTPLTDPQVNALRRVLAASRLKIERLAEDVARGLGQGEPAAAKGAQQLCRLDDALRVIEESIASASQGIRRPGSGLHTSLDSVLGLLARDGQHPRLGLPGGALSDAQLTSPLVRQDTGEIIGVRDSEGRYVRMPGGAGFVSGSRQALFELSRESGGKQRQLYPVAMYGKDEREKVMSTYLSLREIPRMGVYLACAYATAVVVNPELRRMEVAFSDPTRDPVLAKTGGYAVHAQERERRSGTEPPMHLIVVHLLQTPELYQELMRSRRTSAEISAAKMGVGFDELSPELLGVFILLHEMGHVLDYEKNYSNHEEKTQVRRSEMASLPVPNWNPAALALALQAGGQLEKWWHDNKKALEEAGYPDRRSLVEAQERAYHALPTEDYPDQHAAEILRKSGLLELLLQPRK